MASSIIHVFTDFGVKDTDDALLMTYLSQLSAANHPSYLDITFVFTGADGVTAADAIAAWIREYEHIIIKDMTASVSYLTISDYAALESVSCDYVLQIAPMGGYTGSNLSVNQKYVFAGDYITPEGARESFNKVGAQAILDRFHAQGKLVDIPSEHMAKMRFNDALVSKFTGAFSDNIVFTAFMLAYGRMSPTHPANKFAEGLVNPAAGRGANYKSVMLMAQSLLGVNVSDLRGMEQLINDTGHCLNVKSCESSAVNYCDTLVKNGVTLKDRDGSIKCLTDMNIILQAISGDEEALREPVDIFQSGLVHTSDFDVDSIPKDILPAWEFFKKNVESLTECFNPVYDLFAGYVLVGIMRGESRVTHTPEEFLAKVIREF